jgi:hypothetical protein
MASFDVLSRNITGDSNPGPSEYEISAPHKDREVQCNVVL